MIRNPFKAGDIVRPLKTFGGQLRLDESYIVYNTSGIYVRLMNENNRIDGYPCEGLILVDKKYSDGLDNWE